MIRSNLSLSLRALFTLSALALAGIAVGCTNHVESGGETSQDDGTGGTGGGTGIHEPAAEPCTKVGEKRDCFFSFEPQTCELDADQKLVWSTCRHDNPTSPPTNSPDTSSTPLVLSFDRAPVRFASGARGAAFDINGVMSVATDWVAAETPWLALDRDGDGRINDGAELFGSATMLASGARAPNGFVALRELDANGDGRIDASDPAFARLQLWSDCDGNRASQPGELTGLASRRLLAIDLDYTSDAPRCDARGNCEIERAAFRYLDEAGMERAGEIVDVHLRYH